MKTKYIIIILVMLCVILSGCAVRQEPEDTVSDIPFATNYDLLSDEEKSDLIKGEWDVDFALGGYYGMRYEDHIVYKTTMVVDDDMNVIRKAYGVSMQNYEVEVDENGKRHEYPTAPLEYMFEDELKTCIRIENGHMCFYNKESGTKIQDNKMSIQDENHLLVSNEREQFEFYREPVKEEE